MEAIRKLVESRGCTVTKIVTDPGKKLAVLVNSVPGLTTVGSGSHVADIEVEIRVIKERLRCMDASLSVPIPRRLTLYAVYGAVASRNMILRSWQTISSRELFTGVKTDIKRDVRAKFLEHFMCTREPSATDVNGDERERYHHYT